MRITSVSRVMDVAAFVGITIGFGFVLVAGLLSLAQRAFNVLGSPLGIELR